VTPPSAAPNISSRHRGAETRSDRPGLRTALLTAARISGDFRRLAFRRPACLRPAGWCKATESLGVMRRGRPWSRRTARRYCRSACPGTLSRNEWYKAQSHHSSYIRPKGRCRLCSWFRNHRCNCWRIAPASQAWPMVCPGRTPDFELKMSRWPGGGTSRSLAPVAARQSALLSALRPRRREARSSVWVATLPCCCTARQLTRSRRLTARLSLTRIS
jgi:hypothetical protein